MKIAYRKLVESRQAIENLVALSSPFPPSLAVQIARNVRQIEAALKDFNTAHKQMLKPYETDGAVDFAALPKAQRTALEAEYQELLDAETDVDIHPISLAEIVKIEESRPQFSVSLPALCVADFMFPDDSEK